ncbi:MAG: Gfo/Idh/MocA family oxidoreductase, partial [Planctomycetes bacterium]|nr:Gfo/Idh/MocA family oxidoreductase [Planctomycetota bacterium]
MDLTPEEKAIGKENFQAAIGSPLVRRKFLQEANTQEVASGQGLGPYYFGYEKSPGDPIRVGVLGTGDEGNVLINEHPADYMEIVAIADLRPANQKRTFTGSHPVARRGLNAVLGRAKADKIAKNVFTNHRDLLAKKDELGLEAVVIAVPLNQHAPIAIECLEAGLHVICEKLMAQNVTDCKR